jgi:hypothetical protein
LDDAKRCWREPDDTRASRNLLRMKEIGLTHSYRLATCAFICWAIVGCSTTQRLEFYLPVLPPDIAVRERGAGLVFVAEPFFIAVNESPRLDWRWSQRSVRFAANTAGVSLKAHSSLPRFFISFPIKPSAP